MLPNDMYFTALGIDTGASRGRCAKAADADLSLPSPRRGPRRLVGRALIGLGELIAAESQPSGNTAGIGR